MAAQVSGLGITAFSCTPDLFLDLMEAAIQKQDIGQWASRHKIAAN